MASASIVVALGMLFSRVFGLMREGILADGFGASRAVDAYLVAMVIPFVIFTSVGNAITTAFIPLFTATLEKHGRDGADEFTSNVMCIFTAGALLLTIVVFAAAPTLVRLTAPGFVRDPGQLILAVTLTRVVAPMVLMNTWSGIASGVLNGSQRFALPSLVNIPQSACIIAGVWIGVRHGGIEVVAVSTVVGVFVGFVMQWVVGVRRYIRFRWRFDMADPMFRRLVTLVIPVLLATGVGQFGVVVDRILASQLSAGAIAALNYAARLQGAGYGVLGTSISVVLFPTLSSQAARANVEEFLTTVRRGLRLMTFVTAPAVLMLVVFRYPIIRVLFQHGRFGQAATAETAVPLMFFALGTAGLAWSDLFSRAFFALQDTRTPMVAGCAAVACNIVLDLVLVGPLAQGGLALASGVGWLLGSVVLGVCLQRRIGRLFDASWFGDAMRVFGAALVSVGGAYAVVKWGLWSGSLLEGSSVRVGFGLLIAGVVAGGLYAGVGYVLKVRELTVIQGLVRELVRRGLSGHREMRASR